MDKKHYALAGTHFSIQGKWMQRLLRENDSPIEGISGKGLLFSNQVLEKFIEEEIKHEAKILGAKERKLRTYSSGERKKALLKYLLDQQPDFLVLDNLFDALDTAAVATLKTQLIELAEHISIIQIFKRKTDILPFIHTVLCIENEVLVDKLSLEAFFNKQIDANKYAFSDIPKPINEYTAVPEVLIELKQVSVNFHEQVVLKDITWQIKKGEFWQLLGPNGSGKSTLLNMIYGESTKGYGQDLYLFGKKKGSGESVWEIKQKIGFFNPMMTELFKSANTAEEMVVSGFFDSIGLYVKPSALQLKIARQWLSVIGLSSEKYTRFYKLSLLKQRLVLIARAMIKHPPVLILDEPAIELDDAGALMLTTLINKIATESSTAILYVSHRKEKGLEPQYVFELMPTVKGSIGKILQ